MNNVFVFICSVSIHFGIALFTEKNDDLKKEKRKLMSSTPLVHNVCKLFQLVT